jgi:hypothetical protein
VLRLEVYRGGDAAAGDGCGYVVLDFEEVGFAGFGVAFEGESEEFRVILSFVYFAFKSVLVEGKERDFRNFFITGINRKRLRDYLEEGVGVVQEGYHILSDDFAERGGPGEFVCTVGGDKGDEVHLVFAQEQGVAVEEPVFELAAGGNLPLRRGEGRGVELEVVGFYCRDDEEVRGDVVALGLSVTVADSIRIGFLLEVVLLYIVLYDIAGVGELLVERHAFGMSVGVVVFAVADVEDVVLPRQQGAVQIDVVYELAVFLLFEILELARVADDVVHHLLENEFEVLDYELLLDRVLVVLAGVEGKKRIEEIPETAEVITKVFALHIAHLALSYAGVEVALDFGGGLEVVVDFSEFNTEVELVLEVFEDRVVEDNEFLVYVAGLVLCEKCGVYSLVVLDEGRLLDGFVPVYRRTSGIVDLGYLGKQIAVVREEVYQVDSRAEEVVVLRIVVRRDIVQIVLSLPIFFLTCLIAVAGHSPEEPQAQLGQEVFTSLARERVVVIVSIVDVLRVYALLAQQSVSAVNFGKKQLRQNEDRSFVFVVGDEQVADVLYTPTFPAILNENDGLAGFLILQKRKNQFFRVIVIFEVD